MGVDGWEEVGEARGSLRRGVAVCLRKGRALLCVGGVGSGVCWGGRAARTSLLLRRVAGVGLCTFMPQRSRRAPATGTRTRAPKHRTHSTTQAKTI